MPAGPYGFERLMHECFRGDPKTPHIVQEAGNEATILSLVSCRLGVAFVSSATRWRCPESVVWLPVVHLHLPLPFALVWRKNNNQSKLPVMHLGKLPRFPLTQLPVIR